MIGMRRKAKLKVLEKNTETMQALSPRKNIVFCSLISLYSNIETMQELFVLIAEKWTILEFKRGKNESRNNRCGWT